MRSEGGPLEGGHQIPSHRSPRDSPVSGKFPLTAHLSRPGASRGGPSCLGLQFGCVNLDITFYDIRDVLEVLYFCAGIVLAVAAVKALGQLKLGKQALETTKEEIRTRFHRDALILTTQQCKVWADEIVPSAVAWMQAVTTATGTAPVLWEMKDCEFQDSSFANWPLVALWEANPAFNGTSGAALTTANKLEAFAAYFNTRAADEKYAFPMTGRPFCQVVQQLAPYIVNARKSAAGTGSGNYSNTVALYKLWSDRAARTVLTRQVQSLGPPPDELRPIGSE